MIHTYRALIKRSHSPSGGLPLHLIRDDAEASLCGIPRGMLGRAGGFDDTICADCLEWFDRRRAVSGRLPKVSKET